MQVPMLRLSLSSGMQGLRKAKGGPRSAQALPRSVPRGILRSFTPTKERGTAFPRPKIVPDP